jgi:N-acetylglucosamine-6-sulfatase
MRDVPAGRLAKVVTSFAAMIALTLLCVGDGSTEGGAQGVAAQTLERPNIVFVLTDDQFPGSEEQHMPNLNAEIVSKGVEFENMTSTFPLCCPGRATIQRGQYVHNTKIYGNSPPAGGWEKFKRLNLHRSTVATWLNPPSGGAPNYQTGLFGKYMNNYRDKVIPPGWDRWYAWNGVKMGWRSVNDQGNEKPLEPQEADSLVAREALGFLSTRLDSAAPVFAFVNFGAMHEPYYHAQLDADKFKVEKVPHTPAFNEADVSDKTDFVRGLPPLSASKISALDQGYRNGLRSLMRVDRFIGDAADLLRRKGEMGITYFLFYTDNGAHFGQHRFEHGKLQPFEEDVNFPLFMRGPGIPPGTPPRVSQELVGNHDIAPTLADMGDSAVPPFVDGRTLLPLATGTAASWPRTAILSEREVDAEPPNRWDMLRMWDEQEGKVKVYTRHEFGAVKEEYYDLALDPHQLHNALGRSDTTYPPPDLETREHYEQRLDDLYGCGSGPEATMTCRQAENAPLSP